MPTDPFWLIASPLPLLLFGLYQIKRQQGRIVLAIALLLMAYLGATWWLASPDVVMSGWPAEWVAFKQAWRAAAEIGYAIGVLLSLVGGLLFLLITGINAAIQADRQRHAAASRNR